MTYMRFGSPASRKGCLVATSAVSCCPRCCGSRMLGLLPCTQECFDNAYSMLSCDCRTALSLN